MVHLFSRLGYNIAVDTASASVHVLDDVAFDVVSLYGKESDESVVASVAARRGVSEEDVKARLKIYDLASAVEKERKKG